MSVCCTTKAWIVYPDNSAVTSFYLDLVASALVVAGYECSAITSDKLNRTLSDSARREDVFVVDSCTAFLKVYLLGYRNIILWCQGILPEESYMRNRSLARRAVLSQIERFALERAKLVLLVSGEMGRHYEKKYGVDLSSKSYVMPCFNTGLRDDAFADEGKYRALRFTYVGSLAPWQCFDETLQLYKEIEGMVKGASLTIFTFEKDEAAARARALGVERFEVRTLPPDQLGDALKGMSYGFMIRDDVAVNRVATPTKLSSYLSCGVIPIFSECLTDFAKATRGLSCACPVSGLDCASEVVDYVLAGKDVDQIEEECRLLFSGYYSESHHRERLAALIADLLPVGKRVR